jgi:hypothetical protein
MPMAGLKAYFAETFNMLDDFIHNADVLLKHGFIESDNRVDSYSEAVDNIKITAYGLYMFKELAFSFSYLDIICTDTGVFKEETSNYLVEAANEEYALFLKNERTSRVKTRLARVEKIVAYFSEEEQREKELYALGMPDKDMFTTKCRKTFEEERGRVLESAIRQSNRRAGRFQTQ